MLARIRQFFSERGVLEVETPALSQAASVDVHIESLRTESALLGRRYLHTSPEFPMKRLLAAGTGPIFQICRVFRDDPPGRLHNVEFSMLEWYRPGFDHHRLMDEVEELMVALLSEQQSQTAERLSYREAVQREAGIDPFASSASDLRSRLELLGVSAPLNLVAEEAADCDFWLDLMMAAVVGLKLGQDRLCFIYDYPASQAALSRIRKSPPAVAERFELYWKGVELANGFHELANADEQTRRFAADGERRARLGRLAPPHDENLIEALRAGLPDCAGVALGLDRVLMLALGLPSVADTLAFPMDRA